MVQKPHQKDSCGLTQKYYWGIL